jgi:hypothetical protein
MANYSILEGFLFEWFGFVVGIREILECTNKVDRRTARTNFLDMLAEDSCGRPILIEILSESRFDYLQRLIIGTPVILIPRLAESEIPNRIEKVYAINIAFFGLGTGKDYPYKGGDRLMGRWANDELILTKEERNLHKGKFSDFSPEYFMIRVADYEGQIRDTLDEWISFLKNDIIPDGVTARGLREARQRLSPRRLTDSEYAQYQTYLEDLRYEASMVLSHYEVGRLEGYKEAGDEIGRKEGKREIASRMFDKCYSEKQVIDITGLTAEDLAKLSS